VCTRKVLAELFEVTPTTIGIACRRVEMTNRFTTWNQVVGLYHYRLTQATTQPHRGPGPPR
jgi:hypothetical protein